MNRERPVLALVFPCYNEEEVLPHSFSVADNLLAQLKAEGKIAEDSFALYVDDGSKDATWELIAAKSLDCSSLTRGLKLAGNAGHQNALFAGMMEALTAKVDCVISLDVDLQDDISTAVDMLAYFAKGCDVVYGVRVERDTDTWFKRLTADMFYRLMGALKVRMIPHHADYRLCGRNVLIALAEFRESELFLRAIFPSMGFRHTVVTYNRLARQYGVTKYPLRKMLSFAWRGVTSFSAKPLRLAALFSAVFFLFALVQGVLVVAASISGQTTPGWSSMMIVLLLSCSVQLFCLSLIGEYVGKIFVESKRRPRYIVEARTGGEPDVDVT